MNLRRFLIFSIFVLCRPLLRAEVVKPIRNPDTGRLDYITVLSTTTILPLLSSLFGSGTSGQCLMTNGATPPVYSFADCGSSPTVNAFLLLENGLFLLYEDGAKVILQ